MLLRLALTLALSALATHAQTINSIAVGHEYRQDDSPTLAACPDGSVWLAWLSFAGDRDDVAIRQYRNNKWGTLQWVPGTSGDNWLPQIGCDAQNRPRVVWSEQRNGNWDLYERSFDPAKQEWGALARLTSDPLPDINPRLASDGKGRLAVVWQSFRAGHSNILARIFEGGRWGDEIRVTRTAANDWEPAAAFDSAGDVWVVWDSYRAGNYDVYAARVAGGRVEGEELAVAATPLFEARATVAVDSADRVWVAFEEGRLNWGKDTGYTIRDIQPGAPLGGMRRPEIRVRVNGAWKTTEAELGEAFPQGNTYQPHVFSDGKGSVWVAAKTRFNAPATAQGNRGYWEYYVSHLDGSVWSRAVAIPNSKGRSSTRIAAIPLGDGTLVLSWSTDNRVEGFYHRPLHQQVYAGTVMAATGAPASLIDPRPPAGAAAKPAHPNEANDLKVIRAYRTAVDGVSLRIVRGDFHRHTELSWDGGGTQDGNLQDFYRYMIDAASMDFGASTDHQGGAWPYWWWYTQKMTDMYHVPGAYTPIFGYERSATYPFGHRNVFFAQRSASRVTPFHMKAGTPGFSLPQAPIGDEPGVGTGELTADDTRLLYEDIRARNGIAIAHTTATRMGTDWSDNDPDLEPVVEIFQGCRTNYEQLGAPLTVDQQKDAQHIQNAGYQPAGFVNNAWAKGYRLGVEVSSDHGSTHISYSMVYTADTSRQGILDAIRKRHTYGAMDNIVMDVRMGSHFMGDEFKLAKAEPIHVKVLGTESLAEVDIIKDGNVIYASRPGKSQAEFEFLDQSDVAGHHYYYVRVQQANRLMAWASPFFVN
jgi:hypothetical protein